MSRFPIIRRLDMALARASAKGLEVSAIYLTQEDHDALDRAESARWKRKVSALSYRDHEVRRGETTRIYAKHGICVHVPVRA